MLLVVVRTLNCSKQFHRFFHRREGLCLPDMCIYNRLSDSHIRIGSSFRRDTRLCLHIFRGKHYVCIHQGSDIGTFHHDFRNKFDLERCKSHLRMDQGRMNAGLEQGERLWKSLCWIILITKINHLKNKEVFGLNFNSFLDKHTDTTDQYSRKQTRIRHC